LKELHANSITHIYYLNRQGSVLENEPGYLQKWNLLVERMKIKITVVDIDTQWLQLSADKFSNKIGL